MLSADFLGMMTYYSSHTENEVYYYHGDLCGSRAQSQACLSYAEMQQSVSSKHLGSANWITDASGHPIQHLQYLPFGERYIDQRVAGSTYQERFRFTGKEKDEETGYGYFGARYMDHELLTSFISVDRYADKYPSISPYAYCAWNPIKLTDPSGDTVVLSGDAKLIDKALNQIRERSNNLYFSLEENGRLKAIQRNGRNLSEDDKYMLEIINSDIVNINLRVRDNNYVANGYLISGGGGSYCGNSLMKNLEGEIVGANALQAVNIESMAKYEKMTYTLGELIWHEISEAYEGGLIAIREKKPSPPSNKAGTTYEEAHCAANRHFLGNIGTDDSPNPQFFFLYNKCKIQQ